MYLITIRQPAHTRHDAKDVVVNSVDADFASAVASHRLAGERKVKGGVIDTREVAGARWLVLFGGEGERVHVDTGGGDVFVVLKGLNEVEVAAFTFGKAVMTVELEFSNGNGVLALVEYAKVNAPSIAGRIIVKKIGK